MDRTRIYIHDFFGAVGTLPSIWIADKFRIPTTPASTMHLHQPGHPKTDDPAIRLPDPSPACFALSMHSCRDFRLARKHNAQNTSKETTHRYE